MNQSQLTRGAPKRELSLFDSTALIVGIFSRDGTRSLILASNANEPRHYGPPRVEETDIVKDFAGSWDFIWLKEIRFDSSDPERTDGPWAWSALVRPKAKAK